MIGQNLVDFLNEELKENTIVEKLNYLEDAHRGSVIFTTSFGYEDQVITDIIFKNRFDIKVVTLDTGRLFRKLTKFITALSINIKNQFQYIFHQPRKLKNY
jgi:phosphoadenosine phosphosulfate reductase